MHNKKKKPFKQSQQIKCQLLKELTNIFKFNNNNWFLKLSKKRNMELDFD